MYKWCKVLKLSTTLAQMSEEMSNTLTCWSLCHITYCNCCGKTNLQDLLCWSHCWYIKRFLEMNYHDPRFVFYWFYCSFSLIHWQPEDCVVLPLQIIVKVKHLLNNREANLHTIFITATIHIVLYNDKRRAQSVSIMIKAGISSGQSGQMC